MGLMLRRMCMMGASAIPTPPLLKTVTGTLLHITDALAKPAKKFTATLEPIQDLHGYENPWPAGGGKNLLDWELVSIVGTHYGITFTKNEAEGTLTLSGTLTNSGSVAPIQYLDYSLSGKGYVFLTEHISGDTLVELNKTYGLRTDTEKSIAVYMTGEEGKTYTETIRVSVYAPPSPAEWTPYSNICPITGHTGANVVRTGKNLYSRENGQYNVPVYATGGTTAAYADVNVVYIPVKPNTKYSITFQPNPDIYYVRWIECDENKGYVWRDPDTFNSATSARKRTYTTRASTKYLQIAVNQWNIGNLNRNDWEICIQEGTDTTYYPYSGETYPITFPSEAGTVYGGTLTNEGTDEWKLRVDMGICTYDGSENWSMNGAGVFNRNLDGSAQGLAKKGKCNILPVQTAYSATTKGILFGGSATDTYMYVCGFQNEITSVADFKTFLSANNMVVCYPIATPIDYTITESQALTLLKGENVVWCDNSDDLELQYYAKAEETP